MIFVYSFVTVEPSQPLSHAVATLSHAGATPLQSTLLSSAVAVAGRLGFATKQRNLLMPSVAYFGSLSWYVVIHMPGSIVRMGSVPAGSVPIGNMFISAESQRALFQVSG